jgi:hypothetical protein
MGRKSLVHGFKMLDAVAASSAQTSAATNVEQVDKLSIHCLFTNASSGTFIVEARNGSKDGWYALDFGVPLTVTAETNVQIVLNESPFTDIRLTWTPSSASGTMTASLTMKAVGA